MKTKTVFALNKINKLGSIGGAAKTVAGFVNPTVSTAADLNSASHVPHAASHVGSNFKTNYALAEGVSSAGALTHEGIHALKHTAPIVNQVAAKIPYTPIGSAISSTAGAGVSALSRVAPWMWAGNMAMEGVNVATNPKESLDDATSSLESKGPLGRAWYGFTNPIKTIAATGRAFGELVGSYTPSNNSGQQFIPRPQQNNIQQNSFLPKPTGSPQPMPSTQNSFLPKPVGTPQPIQKTSSQDKFTGLQTTVPNETPEALYGRIMSKNLNVDQFFNNAIKHDWKIPGVPGFLARTVARKAQQNPDPYLNSLRNKVQKSTIIDAIKRNPEAFKNVSNNTLNTTNIT
jgi:hypothetical protein